RKIKKTGDTGRRKIPSPAEAQKQQTQHWNSNRRRKFRRGVKHRCRQTAFVLGEPVAGGFRIGRKRRRFANPQEKTRAEQTSDAQPERNRPPPARNFFAATLCLWHGLRPFAVAIIAYPARAPTKKPHGHV